MSFEVVIIGGGPAGLAAAAALGVQGVRTLLCESGRWPADKACGEGLMPSGVADLQRLGVSASQLAELGRPLRGVRYFAETGRVAEARFAEGPGLGLPRRALSRLLLARVRQLPSVTVLEGTRGRLLRGARYSVQLNGDGGAVQPRLIVGADGLNSRVRRQAGIACKTVPPLRWGVRRHYAVEPWTDLVEVHWARGAEAYVTPVAPGSTNVALLFERDLGAPFDALLSRFPALERRLRGARASGAARAAGPLHQWPPRPYAPGLVLLGDAAGYVDALTGEGVGLALRHALLLAEVLGPRLDGQHPSPLPLAALEELVTLQRRASRGSRRLTRLLLWIGRHPRLLDRAVAALASHPPLFRHCLSVNQGTVPWYALPLPSGASLLSEPAHALRHRP